MHITYLSIWSLKSYLFLGFKFGGTKLVPIYKIQFLATFVLCSTVQKSKDTLKIWLNLINSKLSTFTDMRLILAQAVAVVVGRCSGNWLAVTIVEWYFHHSFPPLLFYFSVTTFSCRKAPAPRIKKPIQLIDGSAQNPGVNPFPDPVSHFGAPWRPFWIFEVLIEGMIESKILARFVWFGLFPDTVGHFG